MTAPDELSPEPLETEMSGLRDRLTSLRAESLDIAPDLLAILGPPVGDSSPELDQGVEFVSATRLTPELPTGHSEF